ncbi:MAG: triose-phosphate isomerase [Bacilli bacterium]|nr:triose-phosphate isomerase [Bacilli bacterium]
MENKMIVANLKNYMNYPDTLMYLNEIKDIKDDVIFIPSNIYLTLFKGFNLGVQDISYLNEITTGEITASLVKSMGINYVMISHNERLINLNETTDIINKKIDNALHNDLKVIFCVGEIEKCDFDIACNIILNRLKETIFKIDESKIKNIIIAYEPFYAINSGVTQDILFTQKIVKFIKKSIFDRFNTEISVLYGGSVSDDNIESLKTLEVDGFLIGKASTKSISLKNVVRSIR